MRVCGRHKRTCVCDFRSCVSAALKQPGSVCGHFLPLRFLPPHSALLCSFFHYLPLPSILYFSFLVPSHLFPPSLFPLTSSCSILSFIMLFPSSAFPFLLPTCRRFTSFLISSSHSLNSVSVLMNSEVKCRSFKVIILSTYFLSS